MELSQFDFDENENGVIELKRKHCTLSKTSEPKKPKLTKKPAPPTKWPELPVVTNKARDGKKEPRKLYPLVQDLIELGDDDATAPKTPKMVKRANNRESIAADLTPANFRSSHYADPKKAMNRALENGNKINEHALKKDATKFNPNATFSYRNAAYENKSREQSAVVFSQADSTSPNAVSDSSFWISNNWMIYCVFFLWNSCQDQKKDKSIFDELSQVAADGDDDGMDDGMDVDVPLDINCNYDEDARRQKNRQLKKVLHKMKESLDQAIEIISDDDNDGDDDGMALNKH